MEDTASPPSPPAGIEAETHETDSRCRRLARAQEACRHTEHLARAQIVSYVEEATGRGVRCAEQAQNLKLSERTLRYWKQKADDPPSARGRTPGVCPPGVRRAVRGLLRITGPAIGLPAFRALFPDVPRCQLADRLERFRLAWRRKFVRHGMQLTWTRPGTVWAMDFSKARHLIDGQFCWIFAVRDLASHRQLIWQPVSTQTAEEILPILRDLAERYGAPLVLKSDNGAAFIASLTQLALTNLAVVQLFSPPACPQYNGELERSNGTLKDSTHAQALLEGHPSSWTSHNLDQARCLANNCSRPWGPTGPTPEEAWNARTPISADERAWFLALLEQHRVPARHEVGCEGIAELNHYAKSEIDRLGLGCRVWQYSVRNGNWANLCIRTLMYFSQAVD